MACAQLTFLRASVIFASLFSVHIIDAQFDASSAFLNAAEGRHLEDAEAPPKDAGEFMFYYGSSVWTESSDDRNANVSGATGATREKIYIAAFGGFTERPDASALMFKIIIGTFLDMMMSGAAVLPDYELVVEWYDCGFDNHAAAIVEALSRPDRNYVAILGTDANMREVGPLTLAARMPQVSMDRDLLLSDRVKYPYVYRSLTPTEGRIAGTAWFLRGNGWKHLLVITRTIELIQPALDIFDAWQISYSLIQVGESATGTWGERWQDEVLQAVRQTRIRIRLEADNLQSVDMSMTLGCYLFQNRVKKMVTILPANYPFGFQRFANERSAQGYCTPEEFMEIFVGTIHFMPNTLAPGLLLSLTGLKIPGLDLSVDMPEEARENGGSLANIPITCAPAWTPTSVFNSLSILARAIGEGLPLDELVNFVPRFGFVSDAFCTIALMLQEAIYGQNMTLPQIEKRSPATYEELNKIIAANGFFGLSGFVKYDPLYGSIVPNYYAIFQPNYTNETEIYGEALYYMFKSGNFTDTESLYYMDYKTTGVDLTPFKWHLLENGTVPDVSLVNSFLQYYPDCARINGVLVDTECIACSAGTYYDAEVLRCRNCTKGYFQALDGQDSCDFCNEGTFADTEGSTSCKRCSIGQTCAFGAKEETPCQPGQQGFLDSETGFASCMPCALGTFQVESGKTVCTSCGDAIPGSSSTTRGSINNRDCVCLAGSYLSRKSPSDLNGSCAACLEGTVCPGGIGPCDGFTNYCRGPILQQERFNAGANEFDGGPPSYIVTCSSSYNCPADQPLGTCPPHRVGLACELCEVNYIDEGKDGCVHCDQREWYVGLCLTGVAVLVFAVGLYFLASREVTVQNQTIVTIALAFTLTINVIQALGAFSGLSVEWVDPMKTLGKMLQLLTFRVDFMNLPCFLDSNSPALEYAASLMVYPFFAVILTIFLIIAYFNGRPITRGKGLNVQGLVYMIAYLALSIVSVLPWQCEANPDGSYSVVSSRTVLCFESDEHTAMIILSSFGFLLYGCGFVALIGWATIVYPREVMRPSGVEFVQRFQFIFARFNPEKYFYGIVYVTRNLFIALFPVVFVNEPQVQLLAMALLVISVAFIQCRLWPWRTPAANALDAFLALFLAMMLFVGCMLMDLNTEQGRSRLATILLIAFILTFGAVIGLVVTFVARALIPTRQFGMFLCHHKGGAAVLARWFKELMTPHTTDRIFLDSDELDRLDLIFSVIAFDTKNVVAILTSETLNRMWCAGEITSAIRSKINVVPVACDDYVPPNDEYLQALGDLWSSGQKAELYALGVDIPHIDAAYRSLRQIEVLPLARKGSLKATELVTEGVLKRCTKLSRTTTNCLTTLSRNAKRMSVTDLQGKPADIVMLGNTSDVEAGATCQIIQLLLQRKMQIPVGCCDEENEEQVLQSVQGAFYLIVVLSRDLLRNPKFASTLVKVIAIGTLEVVPLQADQNFNYPDPTFWKLLEASSILDPSELSKGLTLKHVAAAYKVLFTKLALRFSPHGSNRIQRVEIEDMIPRFRAITKGSDQAGNSDTLPPDLLHSLKNFEEEADQPSARLSLNADAVVADVVAALQDVALEELVISDDLPWEESKATRMTPVVALSSALLSNGSRQSKH